MSVEDEVTGATTVVAEFLAAQRDTARAVARALLAVAESYERLDVAMPSRLRRIIATARETMAGWEAEAERVPYVQEADDGEGNKKML